MNETNQSLALEAGADNLGNAPTESKSGLSGPPASVQDAPFRVRHPGGLSVQLNN
jgi:hypothetical protein